MGSIFYRCHYWNTSPTHTADSGNLITLIIKPQLFQHHDIHLLRHEQAHNGTADKKITQKWQQISYIRRQYNRISGSIFQNRERLPASTMAGLLCGHTERTFSTRDVVHNSFSYVYVRIILTSSPGPPLVSIANWNSHTNITCCNKMPGQIVWGPRTKLNKFRQWIIYSTATTTKWLKKPDHFWDTVSLLIPRV